MMARARAVVATAAALSAIAMLAGCGGGDDESAEVVAAADSTGLPAAEGVGAEASAELAIAGLGVPGEVDATRAGQSLAGLDSFGAGRDTFAAQVREPSSSDARSSGASISRSGGASAAAGTSLSPTPRITVPTVPIPPVTPTPVIPPVATIPTVPAPVPVGPSPTTSTPAEPGVGVPGTAASGGGSSGWARTNPAPIVPQPGAESGRLALRAELNISGEPITAREGEAVPPETQEYTVVTITRSSMVLRMTAGILPNGRDTITIELGEDVSLQNAQTGRTDTIALVGVRTDEG